MAVPAGIRFPVRHETHEQAAQAEITYFAGTQSIVVKPDMRLLRHRLSDVTTLVLIRSSVHVSLWLGLCMRKFVTTILAFLPDS